MKYSLLVAALLALFLVGCGDPKPGNQPPSLYDESESAPGDEGFTETPPEGDPHAEYPEMPEED